MKKILILCLLNISFSQQFDYSKMSETEKIMMYNSMKKSPVAAGFLEIIPTAGYAYAGNWKRGLKVKGLNVLPLIGAIVMNSDIKRMDSNQKFAFKTIIATGIGIWSYSFYDAVNQTSKYNKRLKRQIFGKKKKNRIMDIQV